MTEQARRAVLSNHRNTIEACIETGRQVAAAWPDDTVSSSEQIVDPLGNYLDAASLSESLLAALRTAVDSLGGQLRGNPVPAPPYLVVTSTGPICRGTLADGRRVVVRLELFAVTRRPREYTFRDPTPEDCLSIEVQ